MMNWQKEKPPLPEQDFFATFFIDWKKVETEFALETGLSLLANCIEVAEGRTRMRRIFTDRATDCTDRSGANGYASRVTRHASRCHAVTRHAPPKSCIIAFSIRLQALVSSSSEAAKESRKQLSAPKGAPGTVATLASSRINEQKSSEFCIWCLP